MIETATAIMTFDADTFLPGLGLHRHLSLTRRNGLAAMAQRLPD
jgi:cysteine desulfurase / selenocysteine lyase